MCSCSMRTVFNSWQTESNGINEVFVGDRQNAMKREFNSLHIMNTHITDLKICAGLIGHHLRCLLYARSHVGQLPFLIQNSETLCFTVWLLIKTFFILINEHIYYAILWFHLSTNIDVTYLCHATIDVTYMWPVVVTLINENGCNMSRLYYGYTYQWVYLK